MSMKGVVAAGHARTAEAAAAILREGGNAYDAALAAVATAFVAEPVLASLGGGGFLLARPADGQPVLYDFFVQTPKVRRSEGDVDFYPILADFGAATQEFHIGLGAAATPGVARGLATVHRERGRLPLTEIYAQAIALAKAGVEVTPFQSYLFDVVGAIYTAHPSAKALFGSTSAPEGLVQPGDVFRNPELAEVLDALAREGERLFYEGEIAHALSETCAAEGGHLNAADLASYEVAARRPLELAHHGARVLANPPPSCGGILIACGLRLLEDPARDGFGTPAHLTALARAMEATDKARLDSGLNDGDEAAAARLLDPAFLAAYATGVLGRPAAPGRTTHVSVVDRDGNAAAVTLTNGEGCGRVVPGLGFMLNNMLGEEDLNPRGFHEWTPNVRMASMMAPTAVVWPGGRVAVLGSGGSNRIRTAILQVLSNLIDFALAPEEAVTHPRLHWERGHLDVEPGFPATSVEALTAAYPDHRLWPELNLFFGGAHTALLDPTRGLAEGAGDPRRGGATVVV